MEIVPFGVCDCLYTGISNSIDYLKQFIDQSNDKPYQDKYKRTREALEWYKDNCIVSYDCIKEEFDELTEMLGENK